MIKSLLCNRALGSAVIEDPERSMKMVGNLPSNMYPVWIMYNEINITFFFLLFVSIFLFYFKGTFVKVEEMIGDGYHTEETNYSLTNKT